MIPFLNFEEDFLTTEDLLFLAGASGVKAVEDTATGNPVTFQTDLAKPLKSLVANFLPIQSGTGDPSPTNIRQITGWTGVDVWHGGKNLFNKDNVVTGVWWRGNILTGGSYDNYRASDKIPVLPNVWYILTRQSIQQGAVCYFDKDKQYVDQQTWDRYTPSRVIPDGVYYVSFTVEAEYIDSAQFEVGQTDTAYEPYKPITSYPVTWSTHGTIYGGYVDMVTGEVWASWVSVDPSDLPWAYSSSYALFSANTANADYLKKAGYLNIKSDKYKTVDDTLASFSNNAIRGHASTSQIYVKDDSFGGDVITFKASDFQIVYELSEPVLITTLTPQQINALTGNNTVWSDGNGDCEVTYLKKG